MFNQILKIAKKLSKSLRKHIRKEKARIRHKILDLKEQEKLIQELYQRIIKSRNLITNETI